MVEFSLPGPVGSQVSASSAASQERSARRPDLRGMGYAAQRAALAPPGSPVVQRKSDTRTLRKGLVSPVAAAQADAMIHEYARRMLPGIKLGNPALGARIRLVDDADYQMAYLRDCERRSTNDLERNQCDAAARHTPSNAFVDVDDVAWVHIDRARPGTVIHEALHVYSNSAWSARVGRIGEEGAAEFFTREVIQTLCGEHRRVNYDGPTAAVSALADVIGSYAIAMFFFTGDPSHIANNVQVMANGREKFDAWAAAMRRGRPFDAIFALTGA